MGWEVAEQPKQRPHDSEAEFFQLGCDRSQTNETYDDLQAGIFVEGMICDSNIKFLVDTGSSHTVISKATYANLETEKRPELTRTSFGMKQADGKPIDILGSAWMNLKIGTICTAIEVIVADIFNDGILGVDFLLKVKGSLWAFE